LIEVKNLTKKYGDNIAVSNLNFTVEKGKIYGFLGPNGAGKSTTMNIITGCLAATEGQVLINGHDIFEEPKEAKSHIGYLPEQPPVYPEMTPYEYLRFVGMAKGLRKADLAEQIEIVIGETQIDDVRDRLIKNLSKGYRQRVGIAQAMLGNPEIIILDEPTVGLDPKQIIEIRTLIKSLGKQRTVILSSHILPEVSAICDYVMIIAKGRLVASDTLENLSNYLTGDKTMDLSVKGEEGKIRMALNEIAGILEYEITPSKEGAGIYDIVIKSDRNADIRESIYFAFCNLRFPILNMVNEIITLEDVFLRLTTDPNEVKNDALQLRENLVVEELEENKSNDEDAEDDEDKDESEDEDKVEKDDKDDDDDDKKSGGSYKPMFR
jgi:ABC-2 type transport system ATP-binding protein